jgi:ubiquinone/menaquinone biosynthesis C-methylase UbiE
MTNFVIKDDLEGIATLWDNLDIPDIFGPAKEYALTHQEKTFDYYVNRLLRLTPSGGRALDAGCGTGTWCLPMSQLFDEVIGIDQNRRRVDLAKWLVHKSGSERVHIDYGDVRELEIEDESLDFVFCNAVIISYLSLKSVLREFHRVLKPGGLVYVCLNGQGWTYYLKEDYGKKSPDKRVIGMRGLYKNICQRQHFNINNQLSEFVAIFAYDTQFKSSLSKKLKISIENTDHLIESLLKPISLNEITFPKSIIGKDDVQRLAYLVDLFLEDVVESKTPKLTNTLSLIVKECDKEYKKIFGKDLLNLFSGLKNSFSFITSGQEYTPEEVGKIIDVTGYGEFRWAGESSVIGKEGLDNKCDPLFLTEYNGNLCVWEFLTNKI